MLNQKGKKDNHESRLGLQEKKPHNKNIKKKTPGRWAGFMLEARGESMQPCELIR